MENIKPTEFAPAERLVGEELVEQIKLVGEKLFPLKILDFVPSLIVILNKYRQIIFFNKSFYDFLKIENSKEILGKRPGETLECVNSFNNTGGCGTTKFCQTCGIMSAILMALNNNNTATECRIKTASNDAVDLLIRANPIQIDGDNFIFYSLIEISNEKRRQQLERLFFHDVLNTAGGIKGVLDVINQSSEEEMRELMPLADQLTITLIEEIKSHRSLIQAESESLAVNIEKFYCADIVTDVIEVYRNHGVAENKNISVSFSENGIELFSDKFLVRRVLGNLLKNALEASKAFDTVRISYRNMNGGVEFGVNNSQFIPFEIQMQLFQRSFSTKGLGRGIGTYSVKLFAENYLNGRVYFDSSEQNGTNFYVWLPNLDNHSGT